MPPSCDEDSPRSPSRPVATHAAERNIDERLGALRTEFHLQRQTVVTTRLLDIVSGFEVLWGAGP